MKDKCDRIVREVQLSVLDEFCQYFWIDSRLRFKKFTYYMPHTD